MEPIRISEIWTQKKRNGDLFLELTSVDYHDGRGPLRPIPRSERWRYDPNMTGDYNPFTGMRGRYQDHDQTGNYMIPKSEMTPARKDWLAVLMVLWAEPGDKNYALKEKLLNHNPDLPPYDHGYLWETSAPPSGVRPELVSYSPDMPTGDQRRFGEGTVHPQFPSVSGTAGDAESPPVEQPVQGPESPQPMTDSKPSDPVKPAAVPEAIPSAPGVSKDIPPHPSGPAVDPEGAKPGQLVHHPEQPEPVPVTQNKPSGTAKPTDEPQRKEQTSVNTQPHNERKKEDLRAGNKQWTKAWVGQTNEAMRNFLGRREDPESASASSYGYDQENEESHALGRYQLTQGSLENLKLKKHHQGWSDSDFARKYGIKTDQDFRQNEAAQEEAMTLYMEDLNSQIQRLYDKYNGKHFIGVAGVSIMITKAGLIAAAHRSGAGALGDYLKKYEAKDTKGKVLSEDEAPIEMRLRLGQNISYSG